MAHRPLRNDCLRILHVHGGDFDEKIVCSLEHVHFETTDLPTYETISYCWGTDPSTVIISVDGVDVDVPRNAAEALRWLRPDGPSTRALWIDSICINQHNLDERSQQVARMHEIYSHATKNLIWLCLDDGTVKAALENVDLLMADIMVQTNNLATFPIGPGPNHHLHQASGISINYELQPIVRLLSRSWFSRLWVVQEATLAKANTCYCGSFMFDLVPLLQVAKWLWTKRLLINLHNNENYSDVRQAFAPALSLYNMIDQNLGWFHVALRSGWFDESGVTAPLLAIPNETTFFQATQAVDHVFGILGLWLKFSPDQNLIPSLLQPDYRKSTADVFRDATRFAMMEAESLAFMQGIHHRPGNVHLYPSWVRTWNRDFDPRVDPTPFHRGTFAHGKWICDRFEPAINLPDSVMLEGVFIDSESGSRIDVTTETFTEKSVTSRFIDDTRSLIRAHAIARYLDHEELALRTTLVAAENAERDVASEEDLQGFYDLQKQFWRQGKMAPNVSQLFNDPEYAAVSPEIRRAVRYGEAAWRMCHLRKFFITAAGKVGLGPQTMQKGDLAVVLYGCEWPLILRRDESRGTHQMIGTAWIYGVMKGEAVDKHMALYGEDADEAFTIE